MIRADPYNERSKALELSLGKHLDLSKLPGDLCLVLGGDGYLLQVIAELGNEYIYLGLNTGHLGFMLNDPGDPEWIAKRIAERDWNVREVPRLRADAKLTDGSWWSGTSLNDAYLERMTGQTCHLRVSIDGIEVVERLVCDGIIAATAIGSTAYSFSAGGPACHPALRLIQLTAICPHVPRMAPITLPLEAVVEVEVLYPERRPTRVVADGVDHDHVASVRIADAGEDVRLAYFKGHHPTATLIQKMLKV